MHIPTEYNIDDPDYVGGGLKEDIGLLPAFVKVIKQQEKRDRLAVSDPLSVTRGSN